ncbi:MAG: polyphosphate kinase 1, partial [Ruminococcus sp.]|nr:polyphosphate kinase 1 [Ruminococcus sp.]
KDVLVLVELRARFDEENNIGWSKRLEQSGVRVIYGPEELKVHSKLLLITRKIGSSIKYTTQIGTGNYNEKTSALYTDVSLMTANENIAKEAAEVFNSLSTDRLVEESRYLLVSPLTLRPAVVRLMDAEIAKAKRGEEAFVGAKLNSLTDKVLIDKLIECSQAGVKVNLVIRGICCLIPQVKGYTDNITVVSIVGRYLEHARFYMFGADEETRKVYISSADFMTRNTIRRVEVAAPIYDKEIKARIIDMFNTMLNDNIKARVLGGDGIYLKRSPNGEEVINAQEVFYREAVEKARLFEDKQSKPSKQGIFRRILNLFTRKRM